MIRLMLCFICACLCSCWFLNGTISSWFSQWLMVAAVGLVQSYFQLYKHDSQFRPMTPLGTWNYSRFRPSIAYQDWFQFPLKYLRINFNKMKWIKLISDEREKQKRQGVSVSREKIKWESFHFYCAHATLDFIKYELYHTMYTMWYKMSIKNSYHVFYRHCCCAPNSVDYAVYVQQSKQP